MKKNKDFKERNRINENAKEYLYGRIYNKELLTKTYSCYKEISGVTAEEIDYCQNILNFGNYFKNEQQKEIIQKFKKHKDKDKLENSTMKVSSINFTLLLLSKVQLRIIHNNQ